MMEENNNRKGVSKQLAFAIAGVALLVVAVAGSAYAYYVASVQNTNTVTGNAGAGAPTLTVTKVSTSATGNLIPIDMTADMLTSAAKGYGNAGTSFDATKACKDKNGYSVCQIYSVTLTNNSDNTMGFDIGVTALSGTNTPNVDVVKMASNVSVTGTPASIKGSTTGIASGVSIAGKGTSSTYYIMVFIKNINSAQTDNGKFTGTITATSTAGANVKATF